MFGSLSTMMSHGFKSSKQDFTFGPWKVTAAKNHIMKSKDIERWGVHLTVESRYAFHILLFTYRALWLDKLLATVPVNSWGTPSHSWFFFIFKKIFSTL